ncbi:MAG: signal recognition particle protein, partial [Ruminococcaceae bacterium]|nr:signal recognition particle protein [Oscillospiraceae bacterium]
MAFEGLSEKLSAAFKKLRSKGKLTESDVRDAMREVRMALLEADVNFKVAKEFTARITEKAVGSEVLESLTPAQQVIKIVNDELTEFMGGTQARLAVTNRPPCIIMLCGLQGSGKTTHAGKLAKKLKSEGHRPLLVACDIYRPAAIEQLKVVGSKADVPVFEMGTVNPVNISKAAIMHAREHGNDYVILDTAGRLHIDEALMNELKNVKEAVSPNEIMLVIDAMTGQDAVNVAESFNNTLGIDGVLLTKLDGDTRGGAALSVRHVTGKPIKFVGTGEKIDDLEPFHPSRMASRILGMGDVLSFIERAEQQIDEKKALELEQKIRQSTFDFNDLLDQFEQMQKMGPVKQLLGMLPGMEQQLADVDIDERQFDRTMAIIKSMTPAERSNAKLLNASRKRRIAAGSGMKVEDVNRLIKQLEMMQNLFKQLGSKTNKKGKKRMMPSFSQMRAMRKQMQESAQNGEGFPGGGFPVAAA